MLTPKEKAIDYLSRRDHSRLELEKKLRAKKYSESDIASAILALEKKNYINDENFAESYVRYRKNAGFGPLRIMTELRHRGVSDAVIDKAIHGTTRDEWREHLKIVFEKKFSVIATTMKDKEKQFRFLLSRGFSAEAIGEILFDH